MKNMNYDLTPLAEMVNIEYTPIHIIRCLDEVLHQYVVSKFESGECGHDDAVNVSTLRQLMKAFGAVKERDFLV